MVSSKALLIKYLILILIIIMSSMNVYVVYVTIYLIIEVILILSRATYLRYGPLTISPT